MPRYFLQKRWTILTAIVIAVLSFANQCMAADGFSIEGFSRPNRIAQVSTAISGIVAELTVREGSAVLEGQRLCRLDSEVHEKLLNVAVVTKDSVGEINAARAELLTAQRRYETIRELASHHHSSSEELQRAEGSFQLATANLQVAQENHRLRLAEYNRLLAESRQYDICAPFDGVVVEFHKQKGEFVGPVEPRVCTVAELKTLSVDFLLPRSYRNEVELDNEVAVHFAETNLRAVGIIYYISPYPDAETGTFMLKIRVDNRDGVFNAAERCLLYIGDSANRSSNPSQKQRLTKTR